MQSGIALKDLALPLQMALCCDNNMQHMQCFISACSRLADVDDSVTSLGTQELLTSSTADDRWDSDCCNIGSPTAASRVSLRPFSPSGDDDRTSAADSMRGHGRARPAGHMLYRLVGPVEGFKQYLHDAGSLQLLLVSPATVQAATLSTLAAESAAGMLLGGRAPQQVLKQLVSQADEVAVGRVVVSLHDLATSGSAEGARLHVMFCDLMLTVHILLL